MAKPRGPFALKLRDRIVLAIAELTDDGTERPHITPGDVMEYLDDPVLDYADVAREVLGLHAANVAVWSGRDGDPVALLRTSKAQEAVRVARERDDRIRRRAQRKADQRDHERAVEAEKRRLCDALAERLTLDELAEAVGIPNEGGILNGKLGALVAAGRAERVVCYQATKPKPPEETPE